MTTSEILKSTKLNCRAIAGLGEQDKNRLLEKIAQKLEAHSDNILAANAKDMDAAVNGGKISDVMLDRLKLDKKRIQSMADGVRALIPLSDPVGKILSTYVRPNGLTIKKVSVPLGVVAIIYESRPNVTADAAALALKSGNACVLRGGKSAFCSARAIVVAMKEALAELSLPPELIGFIEDTSHDSANEMMRAEKYIDLLIPRGGSRLIRTCVENATVPCIETGTGICHVYAERSADFEKALAVIENAKTGRPSVCNAEEVLLVDSEIAAEFLPKLKKRLCDDRSKAGKIPVELRLDKSAAAFISGTPAVETDFDTEFLDYILAVKVVADINEAIAHISAHSTGHSEAIITEDTAAAELFCNEVDSAAVYVNASTRFTDGGEFGLGCEMGISTQKLHARGPMGLSELTTYKYIIHGNGTVR